LSDLPRRPAEYDVPVKSVDEPTSPSDPRSDKMNTHLTIRTILAAGALAAVIGMTSALSLARAGEVDAPSRTLGASGTDPAGHLPHPRRPSRRRGSAGGLGRVSRRHHCLSPTARHRRSGHPKIRSRARSIDCKCDLDKKCPFGAGFRHVRSLRRDGSAARQPVPQLAHLRQSHW
jgi:hypothetical protein